MLSLLLFYEELYYLLPYLALEGENLKIDDSSSVFISLEPESYLYLN
jgi:hypothetical protein